MEKKLVKEVHEFIHRCSEIVVSFKAECFNADLFNECLEYGVACPMDSPIEHILYSAFLTLCEVNFLEKAEPYYFEDKQYIRGTAFYPQVKIGSYRVDFVATHYTYKGEGVSEEKSLVVECDSQAFHDRSEKERRYEKQRDRFLISKGYVVFHFTGTEIMREPFRVASEILAHITNGKAEEILSGIANYE